MLAFSPYQIHESLIDGLRKLGLTMLIALHQGRRHVALLFVYSNDKAQLAIYS